MANQADLDAALDRLEAAVARIVPSQPVDLSAEVSRVNAASDKIEADFPPPAAPAS